MKKLKNILFSKQDKKYKEFHKKLKWWENIIWVRVLDLRQIAKNILIAKNKEEILDFIKNYKLEFYEEKMIKAILLTKIDISEKQRILFIKDFLPQIDSWAVCDIFWGDLKIINKDLWYDFIKKYKNSKEEFSLRFYFVIFFKHFREKEYLDDFINSCLEIKSNYYYANMAVSWAIAEFYLKFPDDITNLLKAKKLQSFVQNKAISKICDSFRVDKKDKEKLKKLKIFS